MEPWNRLVLRVVAMLLSAASAAAAQGTSSAATQSVAAAESALAERLTASAKEEARSEKRQAQRDPLVRSGLTLPEPQLSFETTKGNGRATGTIGVVQQHRSGETSVLVAVSSPIGSAPDAEAHPVDLRGLANGATVSVGFNSAVMFKTFSVRDIVAICAGIPKEDCTA